MKELSSKSYAFRIPIYISLLVTAFTTVQCQNNFRQIAASDFFQDVCTSGSDCLKKDVNSDCAADPSTPGIKKCACRSYNNYQKVGESCKVLVPVITGMCGENVICTAPNTECKDEGVFGGVKRCLCKKEYTQVNTTVCAKLLTNTDDPACSACQRNDGECYTLTTGKREGCKCKVSRFGNNCEQNHVNVKCKLANMSMTVCYSPHEGFNFTNPSTILAVTNTRAQSCRSSPGNGVDCESDQQQLSLSLADQDLGICSISKSSSRTERKYEAELTATRGDSTEDKVFKVFCKVQTKHGGSFGLGDVKSFAANDQGEQIKPNITFKVHSDNLVWEITSDVAIRRGEKIKYEICLMKDENYGALKILTARLSAKTVNEICKGCSRNVIKDGCPDPGNDYFDALNMFKTSADDNNMYCLRSNTTYAYKFLSYNSCYLHVYSHLCLKGEEDLCRPNTCGAAPAPSPAVTPSAGGTTSGGGGATPTTPTPNAPPQTGRRKRSADPKKDYVISKAINVYDPDELSGKIVLSNGMFAGVLALLCSLIIILLIICIILVLHMRNRKDKVGDYSSSSPAGKQFALPRINRNNMRI